MQFAEFAGLVVLIARDHAQRLLCVSVEENDGAVAVPLDFEEPFVTIECLLDRGRQHGMDLARHGLFDRAFYFIKCELVFFFRARSGGLNTRCRLRPWLSVCGSSRSALRCG